MSISKYYMNDLQSDMLRLDSLIKNIQDDDVRVQEYKKELKNLISSFQQTIIKKKPDILLEAKIILQKERINLYSNSMRELYERQIDEITERIKKYNLSKQDLLNEAISEYKF
jgi:septal ring factor EnvC (AmiA/AmiB activator)